MVRTLYYLSTQKPADAGFFAFIGGQMSRTLQHSFILIYSVLRYK